MNATTTNPQRYYTRILSLAIATLLLLLGIFASIAYGAADISTSQILTAFTNFDDSTEHIIKLFHI